MQRVSAAIASRWGCLILIVLVLLPACQFRLVQQGVVETEGPSTDASGLKESGASLVTPVEIVAQPEGVIPLATVLLESKDPIHIWSHDNKVFYLADDIVGVVGEGFEATGLHTVKGMSVVSAMGHVLTGSDGFYVLSPQGPFLLSTSNQRQAIKYAWDSGKLYYTLSFTESHICNFQGLFVFDSASGESRQLIAGRIGYAVKGLAVSPDGKGIVLVMSYSISEYDNEYHQEVWIYDVFEGELNAVDGLYQVPGDAEEKLVFHATPHWICPEYIVVQLASRIYGCVAGTAVYTYSGGGLTLQRAFLESRYCGGLALAGIDSDSQSIFMRKVLPFACGPWEGPYYMVRYSIEDDTLEYMAIPDSHYPIWSVYNAISNRHFVLGYFNALGIRMVPNDGLVETASVLNDHAVFTPLFVAEGQGLGKQVLGALWQEEDLFLVMIDGVSLVYSLQRITWQK